MKALEPGTEPQGPPTCIDRRGGKSLKKVANDYKTHYPPSLSPNPAVPPSSVGSELGQLPSVGRGAQAQTPVSSSDLEPGEESDPVC